MSCIVNDFENATLEDWRQVARSWAKMWIEESDRADDLELELGEMTDNTVELYELVEYWQRLAEERTPLPPNLYEDSSGAFFIFGQRLWENTSTGEWSTDPDNRSGSVPSEKC